MRESLRKLLRPHSVYPSVPSLGIPSPKDVEVLQGIILGSLIPLLLFFLDNLIHTHSLSYYPHKDDSELCGSSPSSSLSLRPMCSASCWTSQLESLTGTFHLTHETRVYLFAQT